MGIYIYSLRKKSKECDLMGIIPVNVISMEYAYKNSQIWPRDPGHRAYMAAVGRTASLSQAAWRHHIKAAKAEHGTANRPFFVVWGGFKEGNPVYETDPGVLPSTQDDTMNLRNAKVIGRLFKVGRRWSIEQDCPDHDWQYDGISKGDFRAPGDRMLPARTCKRCGKFEYTDSEIQAQYERYRVKEAA